MSKLYITGEINDESFHKFSSELADIEHTSSNRTLPVEVELISDGGSAYAAFAFFDRIKSSPLAINITGIGFIASAAVLILAAGDTRRMTKNAWVMVHEDAAAGLNKLKVTALETEVAHMRALEDQWNRLLASVTKVKFSEWDTVSRETSYMSADLCKHFGLIEEII